MSSLRLRLMLSIAAIAAVAIAVLTVMLYIAAERRITQSDGLGDGLARSFGLLGASAGVLLVGLASWQLGRGLGPIEDMAVQLHGLQRRLEGALEREREFSGHLAHELRTPLTVLRTGLDLALRKQPTGSEAHWHTLELISTVDEMSRLTDNLLLLARVERGAEETELHPVAVRPLVDAVWRRFDEKARTRGLTFENRVPAEHHVDADRGKLLIVIQNLLANAASYTETGGAIAVEGDDVELLSVWDSGPQLEDDQLGRVFDRMWRADLARTDATQHAGLGLSLAQAICRHMKLELRAENAATGGLRFVVARTSARKPELPATRTG